MEILLSSGNKYHSTVTFTVLLASGVVRAQCFYLLRVEVKEEERKRKGRARKINYITTTNSLN